MDRRLGRSGNGSETHRKRLCGSPATNKGEELMTEIREMLKAFEKNEASVYEARSNAATRERIIKTSALAILCVFAVGLLIVSNSYSFVLVRRQLAKLEGVETRIRSIIENILDGMITVDEQGVICSMNPSAEKMFGCINNEMVGHKFTKLVPKSYGKPKSSRSPAPGMISRGKPAAPPWPSAGRGGTRLSRSKFR